MRIFKAICSSIILIILSISSKIKDYLLFNDYKLNLLLTSYQQLWFDNLLFPSSSIIEFARGNYSKKSKYLLLFILILFLLFTIRCTLIAVINRSWIWIVFFDVAYIVGLQVHINALLAFINFTVVMLTAIILIDSKRIPNNKIYSIIFGGKLEN